MKARRFYKSRLFWCGVPGLVFLLWVWWDSGMHASAVRREEGRGYVDVRVMRGAVEVSRVRSNGWPYRKVRFHVYRDRMESGMEAAKGVDRSRRFDLPRFFESEASVVSGVDVVRSESARVALWVMVPGYVVLWLGVVFAWQRRKARVMQSLTEMEMETEKEVAG